MSKGLFASLFEAGQPFALIDTRERRDHVEGHWFGSTNIPLSVLTAQVAYLIPDRAFPIHLLDWNDKASAFAARRLAEMGYETVTLCPTTTQTEFGNGWVRGEFVWSKTFGEVVAHTSDLPEITPAEYLADFPDALLFDVRPSAEYTQFTIPTSQSLPNSLVLGNLTALKDTGQMAVLHCAGRTRSIIGACTLKAAGYDGPYAIFKGGTQAWQLDGHPREHGAQRIFGTEADDTTAVQSFLAKWNIAADHMDVMELGPFVKANTGAHFCDVSEDAATGQMLDHGIIRISGTNLIQQTDRTIARYHVPVILFDRGSGSRAAFAAYWLQCMGYQVQVVHLNGPIAQLRDKAQTQARYGVLTTSQLQTHLAGSGTAYDFRPSQAFCAAHLKGSQWCNLGALLNAPEDDPSPQGIVVIGQDVAHANDMADALAARSLSIAGIYAWEAGPADPALIALAEMERPIDESALFAGRHHGNMQDSRDYLAWEEDLPDQVDQIVRKQWQGM